MDVLTAADLNLMMSSWMYSWIEFSFCDGISDQGSLIYVVNVFLLSFFYGYDIYVFYCDLLIYILLSCSLLYHFNVFILLPC